MAAQTFHTEERLKSHITISRLFKEGQSFSVFPLRVVWMLVPKTAEAFPAQFAVTVPKKNFKKAVERNRLKRKIREAYRLQKEEFYQYLSPAGKASGFQLALLIIYVSPEGKSFAEIDEALFYLLKKLVQKVGAASKKI